MGWKNVKEHYRIGHIVQVRKDKGICIGSPYIHDLIVIGFDGSIIKKLDSGVNEDLKRYQAEMLADMAKLKELVDSPDVFERSITIWTYEGGDIIEKQCEVPEWPNVTHDGEMIYENTFSFDRSQVIEWAKREAGLRHKRYVEAVDEANQRVVELETEMAVARAAVEKLSQL